MNAATILAVFFVPVQYFVIESLVEPRRNKTQANRERARRNWISRSWSNRMPAVRFLGGRSFAISWAVSVGPNYQRPQVAVPPQFKDVPANDATSIADTKWFDLFGDDTLKHLITTALRKNFDIRIAAEHVLEARAQYGITRASLFPTVDLPASFTSQHSSARGAFRFLRVCPRCERD